MTVRLVADIQSRLFWRVGTDRASECCVPSAEGGARHPEMGSDVPTEQRLQGFEPLRCCVRVVLIAATFPSQQRGRCLVRSNVGSADGFTGRQPKRFDQRRSQAVAPSGHALGMTKLAERI